MSKIYTYNVLGKSSPFIVHVFDSKTNKLCDTLTFKDVTLTEIYQIMKTYDGPKVVATKKRKTTKKK